MPFYGRFFIIWVGAAGQTSWTVFLTAKTLRHSPKVFGPELVMLDLNDSAGKQRTLMYTTPFSIWTSPSCNFALRSKELEPDAAFNLKSKNRQVRPAENNPTTEIHPVSYCKVRSRHNYYP